MLNGYFTLYKIIYFSLLFDFYIYEALILIFSLYSEKEI